MQWNFNVQHQVKNNLLFDIAYAGNAGVKLQAQSELNQLADEFLSLGDRLLDPVLIRSSVFCQQPRSWDKPLPLVDNCCGPIRT